MGERDLANLQSEVVGVLQRPDSLGHELAAQAEALVLPSARGMSPTDRLEVYRDQFWIRHLRNLADDFPTLAWAIGGADAFAILAREYLRAYPPRTWDLQRLGASMPEHVERHVQLERDATAVDAARLDWAFMEIFDAPDATAFDPRVLANTPEDAWPGARVELSPALRTLALRSDLLPVRDALKAGEAAPSRPAPCVTHAVVWRDAACFLRSMGVEPHAWALLVRLSKGEALGAACEAVALEAGPDVPVADRVGPWFQEWVQRGWVSRVVVGD